MKRPAWATVVGILGIIFGALGVLNAANTILLPQVIEWQKTFMHSVMANMPAQQPDAPAGKNVAAVFESFWGPVPGWFRLWSPLAGVAGLCLSSAYMYAAISMLQLKRNAVRLFCACSAAAIALASVRGTLGVVALRFMGISILMSCTVSIAFHVVLLLVVGTSNKSAFRESDVAGAPSPTLGGPE